ncbi:DUF2975 domain-containing protein [uncultured Chryseobacterium sp.]|uniref:DUF2975 domain-containing protein n=1 Tax=uncultured Chryseobacterium sp. TaxID=259322 RepID=UPI0025DD4803|nr:DUF2975 domain-containing protein [uncultured Chryseobacterium sp.]
MKITGKRSLLWWARYPCGIYAVGFTIASIWTLGLMLIYFFTHQTNRFISLTSGQGEGDTLSSGIIGFHYPFTQITVNTENSPEGLVLAFLGILSINFILITALKIITELSQDNFFTAKAVQNFKILGFGLLSLGIIHVLIDLLASPQQFNPAQPFVFIVTGFILILMKEIFTKGKAIQDENDLVI